MLWIGEKSESPQHTAHICRHKISERYPPRDDHIDVIQWMSPPCPTDFHGLTTGHPPRDPQPWINKYIFPGGYTPSLSEVVGPIEKSGLIVNDLEVLRMHYSHTLRNWKERFLSKREEILTTFDEKFFRMWEFYLVGCEMAFKWGDQVVYQFQLTKNYSSTPVTRDYIYQ